MGCLLVHMGSTTIPLWGLWGSMGPYGSPSGRYGSCNGVYGTLLTTGPTLGLYGVSIVSIGLSLVAMGPTIGFLGALWVYMEPPWGPMGPMGCPGLLWVPMGSSMVPLWGSMGPYGSPSGRCGSCYGIYGTLCSLRVPLCVPMGLYGALRASLKAAIIPPFWAPP